MLANAEGGEEVEDCSGFASISSGPSCCSLNIFSLSLASSFPGFACIMVLLLLLFSLIVIEELFLF